MITFRLCLLIKERVGKIRVCECRSIIINRIVKTMVYGRHVTPLSDSDSDWPLRPAQRIMVPQWLVSYTFPIMSQVAARCFLCLALWTEFKSSPHFFFSTNSFLDFTQYKVVFVGVLALILLHLLCLTLLIVFDDLIV